MNLSLVLNLGLEYICGSMNALVESDKVYIYRAQIWFNGRDTSTKRLKCCNWKQQTCVLDTNSIRDTQIPQPWKMNELHEIRC